MNAERITIGDGRNGALPHEVLQKCSPEEHRANMHCCTNNQEGGLSQDAIEYIQERKVKRGY
jgi:hypothetical protein